ncbi:MAG: DUF6265 family protein [Pyrinomonadaceae bacterium]
MQILKLFALTTALTVACIGQIKNTENTYKLMEGQESGKATLGDMAWLTGTWTGTGLGGFSEEIWSKPSGGSMIGMYRLIKDDGLVFFETLMIAERDGSIVLRLKHFNSDFTGWEAKDKTVDFKFVNKAGNRMNFSGLTFERVGDDRINIFLALRMKDGSLCEESFVMNRMR